MSVFWNRYLGIWVMLCQYLGNVGGYLGNVMWVMLVGIWVMLVESVFGYLDNVGGISIWDSWVFG